MSDHPLHTGHKAIVHGSFMGSGSSGPWAALSCICRLCYGQAAARCLAEVLRHLPASCQSSTGAGGAAAVSPAVRTVRTTHRNSALSARCSATWATSRHVLFTACERAGPDGHGRLWIWTRPGVSSTVRYFGACGPSTRPRARRTLRIPCCSITLRPTSSAGRPPRTRLWPFACEHLRRGLVADPALACRTGTDPCQRPVLSRRGQVTTGGGLNAPYARPGTDVPGHAGRGPWSSRAVGEADEIAPRRTCTGVSRPSRSPPVDPTVDGGTPLVPLLKSLPGPDPHMSTSPPVQTRRPRRFADIREHACRRGAGWPTVMVCRQICLAVGNGRLCWYSRVLGRNQ